MGKLKERLKATIEKDLRKIEVPEWGDESGPLVLFAGPLTCVEHDKLRGKHDSLLRNPTTAALIDVILLKALDKHGEPAFDLEDREILKRHRSDVIARVATEILYGGAKSDEDLEGN